MDIRAAEISEILKGQIKNFGAEAEVSEVGQVLSIGGVPLILSEFIPADEANTGLYTGSGTYGSIVIGDTGGWRWDVVSALESDWEVSEQHRGAVYIGRKRNYRLTKATASGDKPAAVIYYL